MKSEGVSVFKRVISLLTLVCFVSTSVTSGLSFPTPVYAESFAPASLLPAIPEKLGALDEVFIP